MKKKPERTMPGRKLAALMLEDAVATAARINKKHRLTGSERVTFQDFLEAVRIAKHC